jgi:transglutaminase-like putative cysteine protease
MKVTSPVPSYWRANVLDTFTGDSWLGSGLDEKVTPMQPDFRVLSSPYPTPPGTAVSEHFETQSVYTEFLFTGGVADQLKLVEPVRVWVSDAGALRMEKTLGPDLTYDVHAVVPQVDPAKLVGLGRDYPPVAEPYVALPLPSAERVKEARAAGEDWLKMVTDSTPRGSEFAPIYDLNDQIVGTATDPYEIVLRVEQYLRDPANYHYTLTPRHSDLISPYAKFLFDTHEGFCQQFSGSMALLLRLNGIPARVAVGFSTGRSLGKGVYEVGSNNAHAWVEVFFPGIGWLPFDPTPGNGLPLLSASSSTTGFADPFAHDKSTPATAATKPPIDPLSRLPEGTGSGGSTGGIGGYIAAQGSLMGLVLVLALVGATVAYPVARRVWRGRGLRRGSTESRLRASLRLLRADLRDWGVVVPDSLTWDEVAGVVQAETGLDARPVVESGQRVIFGGRSAAESDLAMAEAFRTRLRRRLRSTRGWSRTVLAWYGAPGVHLPQRRRGKRPQWWRPGTSTAGR